MKRKILFMDNNNEYLAAHAELLELAGYEVTRAPSIPEAERLLHAHEAHLALFDIRMRDDDEENDISGLLFAKLPAYKSLPKIVLTGWPTYEYVREVMSTDDEGMVHAVGFVGKSEGPKALLKAVANAFNQHVQLDLNLVIDSNERNPITFPHLISVIAPEAETAHLVERAEELEGLFRRLFYGKSNVKLDRLLWHRDERVALSVHCFEAGKLPESFVVVCGTTRRIADEALRFRNFAPSAPGHVSTVLVRSKETLRFAANVYALSDADLENIHLLTEAYHAGTEKSFLALLDSLFSHSLSQWHHEKRLIEEGKTLGDVYRERVGLGGVTRAEFEELVEAILQQLPTLGESLSRGSKKMVARYGGQVFTYPDPLDIIFSALDFERPLILMNTPGHLTGDNILTNAAGGVWLTDFAAAGMAPALWNHVTLEAAVRFDWHNADKLRSVHTLERVLTGDEFNRLEASEVDPALRKPLRTILSVRRLISHEATRNVLPYYVGILFQAAGRLAGYDPRARLMPKELLRLGHALIASAVIGAYIQQHGQGDKTTAQAATGIRIDEENRQVWMDGARVSLGGRAYDLLLGLYKNAGRLCTRRQITEQFLGERFDEGDQSQISRLNTAIFRLREKIESDPNHPRYLITESGGGYRLLLKPRK